MRSCTNNNHRTHCRVNEESGEHKAVMAAHQYAMVSTSNLGTSRKEFVLCTDGAARSLGAEGIEGSRGY